MNYVNIMAVLGFIWGLVALHQIALLKKKIARDEEAQEAKLNSMQITIETLDKGVEFASGLASKIAEQAQDTLDQVNKGHNLFMGNMKDELVKQAVLDLTKLLIDSDNTRRRGRA